jgi:predicted GH43/DUF377 family glycosyl hydrolase
MGLAARSGLRLRPDGRRVILRLFIPGQELIGGSESRTTITVERLMALDESAVLAELEAIRARFSVRHNDLDEVFAQHAARVASYVTKPLTPERRQLLGAVFTHEFSLEGSSICNPCLVAHPDQSDATAGSLRVIMSYRAIGEGHRSSIGFRSGTLDETGKMELDEPHPFPHVAATRFADLDRAVFHAKLNDFGIDGETAAYVLDSLKPVFTIEQLEAGIDRVAQQRDTRPNVFETAVLMRAIAECSYNATFDESTDLSERVLWPATPSESSGLEDARFVRLDGDADARYVGTYTAFDGRNVAQQLLETTDFTTFRSTPLAGVGAGNKGLAFFPRRINGRYVALSRHDRESNALAYSSDLHVWDEVRPLQIPTYPWELLQIGNCGSPIELAEGWLVLTHGVGPMRTYGLGALLLDLDDPSKILAQLPRPLLLPDEEEQDGYVPNVVYSCGSIVHAGNLFIPYGIADQSISYATVPVAGLIAALS